MMFIYVYRILRNQHKPTIMPMYCKTKVNIVINGYHCYSDMARYGYWRSLLIAAVAAVASWGEWAGTSSTVVAWAVPASSWVPLFAAGSLEPSWPAASCYLLAMSLWAVVGCCPLTWP